MRDIAKKLVGEGRGIFAADASPKSMDQRLESEGIEAGEETRRRYRQMLLSTAGMNEFIGGIILQDETIRQQTTDGKLMIDLVQDAGIIPGIKVDKGTVDLENFPGEKIAEGLDGLRERLAEYYKMGARFTKWRAVIRIDKGIPTTICLRSNAESLARFAALSQEAKMVPIVEPEVVMEGDHTMEECRKATEDAGRILVSVLAEHDVSFEEMLYKVNMVLPGRESKEKVKDEEVARETVETMRRIIPVEVPGVVFLSGGQNEIDATKRLNEINRVKADVSWRLTFSFERALENATMRIWKGKEENVSEAQKALLYRAKLNCLASMGKYIGETNNQ